MSTRKTPRSAKPEREEPDYTRPQRLDRPFTPEEAREQDQRNRARIVESRRRRFSG
jgi:hypothetical protein